MTFSAAIIGASVTGVGTYRALEKFGARVHIFEGNPKVAQNAQAAGVPATLITDPNELGNAACAAEADYIIASPGIAPHHPVLQAPLATGKVISELDLAWILQRECGGKQPWLLITGTNGKTTTAKMTEAILRQAGKKAFAVGNIGTSLSQTVMTRDYDVLVVEASSFQLHFTSQLSPYSSVCLNLNDDHLDWHGNFHDYAAAKARVFENTQVACFYPTADERIREMVEHAEVVEGARAIGFSLGAPAISELGMVEGILVDRAFIRERHRAALALAEIAQFSPVPGVLPSPAYVTDALVAAGLARSLEVPPEDITSALQQFTPEPHRATPLGEVAQVHWIDDSKATNAHAALAALAGMEAGKTVWIVGGERKGTELKDLVRTALPKLRSVIIIGEDREPWKAAFAAAGATIPVIEVDGHEDFMMSVVHEAVASSLPGDTVLLAPACAAWDQFPSYVQRGEAFAEAVKRLAEQQ